MDHLGGNPAPQALQKREIRGNGSYRRYSGRDFDPKRKILGLSDKRKFFELNKKNYTSDPGGGSENTDRGYRIEGGRRKSRGRSVPSGGEIWSRENDHCFMECISLNYTGTNGHGTMTRSNRARHGEGGRESNEAL